MLDLDLSSSGEHWGTSFLCKYGVIAQNGDRSNPEVKEICSAIGSYDYCYTATIPDDIHVDNESLPAELAAVLKDFRKYKSEISRPSDKPRKNSKKPSLLDGVKEAEKTIKENDKDNQPKNKKEKPEI